MVPKGLAVRYIKNLSLVAEEAGIAPRDVLRELTAFRDLLMRNRLPRVILTSPHAKKENKRFALAVLAEDLALSDLSRRFLGLLLENNRIRDLQRILNCFEAYLLERENIVRVEVTVAYDISADTLATVREGLTRLCGTNVQVEVRKDPSILGGIVARVGPKVYDGSLRKQLEKMRASFLGVS